MWTSFQPSRTSSISSSPSGFTLIELLVATSIVVIITSVMLFRHEQFNSSTLLRSLAYSVALSVRQAQLYGTSVRETGPSGVFADSYAVYFDGDPTQYFLAADVNENGAIAIDGSEDVSPSPYSIQGGYTISNFCTVRLGISECMSNSFIDYLVITFRRPDTDACFATDVFPNACLSGGSQVYESACIEIASPAGDTRTVTVTNTGQISVEVAGSTCTAS